MELDFSSNQILFFFFYIVIYRWLSLLFLDESIAMSSRCALDDVAKGYRSYLYNIY